MKVRHKVTGSVGVTVGNPFYYWGELYIMTDWHSRDVAHLKVRLINLIFIVPAGRRVIPTPIDHHQTSTLPHRIEQDA